MVLWQITSYPAALAMGQRRLHAMHLLATRFGPGWRAAVPGDIAWMLDEGVLLDAALERVSELTASDITPDTADTAEPAPADIVPPDTQKMAGRPPDRRRGTEARVRPPRTAAGRNGQTVDAQALDIVSAEPDITGGELGRRLDLSARHGQRLRHQAIRRLARHQSPA
jgi:hypothetical protein